jgi:GDP-L-fucose synthase
MYKNEKVIVLGGTGVVGIPVVRELVKRGAQVTVVGMEDTNVAKRYLPIEALYKRRNLLDREQCNEVINNHKIVINCAGTKRSVGIGFKNISKFFVEMLNLQTNIMDAAHDQRAERFLFIGSIAEYPPLEIRQEDDVWKGKPSQNDWFTGVQKRIGEVQADAYQLDTGWDAVRIVRLSNVYGPFDDFGIVNSQVIPALISKLLVNSEKLVILGDGSNVRDFIYSDDAAFWSLEALERAPCNYPINIGSGSGERIRTVVDVISEILQISPEISFETSQPSGDLKRVLDITRAREILNFHPRISLYQGIERTIAWFRSNPEWGHEKYV